MPEMKDSGIEWIGEIPKDWKVTLAKYMITISNGSDPKEEGDIPVYGSGAKSFRTCGEYKNGPTVLLGRKGTVDVPQYIEGRYWNVDTAFDVKAKNNYDLKFFYYNAICFDYVNYSTQTALPSMTQGNYYNMHIIDINKVQQQRIADFLDSKCAEIDSLIADIEKEIALLEEYKKSVITEAVTKGLDLSVEMKDSGIKWIGMIPKDWKVYRIADIYEDRNERGNDELPLLSVSINTGVSDKELTDEEQERVFLRSEDKSKYKRVYPGDVTYNMMRAWQGALGAVRVEGMVSPAYVVAKPTGRVDVDSRFIEMLLRSVAGIEEINRYSYGIMDFRKRLYWPQFRIIKVALPNVIEQKRIADYLDEKSNEIDEVISKQKESISMLMDYKKSLIYEYVTGKKEVPANAEV